MCQNMLALALVVMTATGSVLFSQSAGVFFVYASESSPYDSGYDHGCDDAGRDESDKYINQPEKGPSFHTSEFMDGYYTGLSSCSNGGSNNGNEGSRGGDDEGRSGGSRSDDPIQDFCSALGRGDYLAAEGLLASTPYASLAVGARLGCGLIELANTLEN